MCHVLCGALLGSGGLAAYSEGMDCQERSNSGFVGTGDGRWVTFGAHCRKALHCPIADPMSNMQRTCRLAQWRSLPRPA